MLGICTKYQMTLQVQIFSTEGSLAFSTVGAY